MFQKLINKRIKIILLLIILLLIIIALRIIFIETISYQKLELLADDLWSRELPISADRGNIYDRNGEILATNVTTVSLYIVPNQVKNKEETAKILSDILKVEFNDIYEHVTKISSLEKVHPEGRNLSFEIADEISSHDLDGVYLVRESKRYYPNGKSLSHVLGYVGIDNQGLSGLELKYDDYLLGLSGAIKYYADAKGNKLKISESYESPEAGNDIYLTIDYDIQTSLERELDNVMDMFTPDNALAIVMNPKTGEIYGMSSRPSFDPNNYQNFSEETLNRNLPVWYAYEPGSTFKIITTAAVVEEGLINLEKDTFYDSGSVTVEGAKLKCWKTKGHGHQTFLQVFENSCNPGFVSMGLKLGKERLFKYIDMFGFGEKTGIDVSGEQKGILFDVNDIGLLETATTAFGQGVSVTPIQQVTAVSAIVNGGYLYTPYIVKEIKNGNEVVFKNETNLVRKTISENTSEIMKMALESVVTNGGGRATYIEGYRIGGKTGTAQKAQNGRYLVGNYIMSFMAIVPSNDPEAVLYVAIDNPHNTALLSSYTTTPVARRLLLDIIDALDIEKQDGWTEKKYEWTDKKYYDVPNVIGMSLKEAKKYLYNFEIIYEGKGDIVLEQSPEAKTRYYEKGTIKLLLGSKD